MKFKTGQKLKVIKIEPLKGNDVAPPLVLGEIKTIKGIVLDKKGNQHIDVGLESKFNFIRSFETKENLPNGDKIHWCHPSRFEKI